MIGPIISALMIAAWWAFVWLTYRGQGGKNPEAVKACVQAYNEGVLDLKRRMDATPGQIGVDRRGPAGPFSVRALTRTTRHHATKPI